MRTLTAKRYPINDPCAGCVDQHRPKMIRTLKLSLFHNPAHSQTVRHYGAQPNAAYNVVVDVRFAALVGTAYSSNPNGDAKVFEGRSHRYAAPDVAAHEIISPMNRLDRMIVCRR